MSRKSMPRMRDGLQMNDEVTVTLPAHVWLGFYASYLTADWNDYYANLIGNASQEQLLDPVYVREMEAYHMEEHEQAMAEAQSFFTGQPVEIERPPGYQNPPEEQ